MALRAYSQLLEAPNIRLLRLKSLEHERHNVLSSADEPVVCELFLSSLQDDQPYLALSYVWGDSTVTKPIVVDGETIRVGKNLWSAFMQLRNNDSDVVIWIDALCINQTNELEKKEQVKLMREIYTKATHTLCWLGPAEEGSDSALAGLRQLGQLAIDQRCPELTVEKVNMKMAGDWDGFRAREATLQHIVESFLATEQLRTLLEGQILHYRQLLDRSYWRRAWIVQEFAVSQHLVIRCGSASLSFECFRAGTMFLHLVCQFAPQIWARRYGNVIPFTWGREDASLFYSLVGGFNMAPASICGVRHQYQERGAPSKCLMRLLIRFFTGKYELADATLDRDRVFAFLGLASDRDELSLEPDYARSTSDATVYTRAARAIIAHEHEGIDLLGWSILPKPDVAVPSWVPDWRARFVRPFRENHWETTFRASNGHKFPGIGNTDSLEKLSLQGHQLDVIEAVHVPVVAPASVAGPAFDVFQTLAAVRDMCEQSDAKAVQTGVEIYRTPADRGDAHIITPVADQADHPMDRETKRAFLRGGYDSMWGTFQQVLQGQITAAGFVGDGGLQRSTYSSVMKDFGPYRPFLTQKGYVGLAPGSCAAGDVVVIFLGAKLPSLLRPTEDGATYQLVGEIYVHGVMYGEAMTGEVKVWEFVLK